MTHEKQLEANRETVDPAFLLIDRLDQIDPEHHLADPGYRTKLLTSTDPATASLVLAEVNRIVSGGQSDEVAFSPTRVDLRERDPEGREKVGFLGVDPEDRAEIFEYGYHKVQELAEKGELGRAAALLGGLIVGLQSLADGNKRTARVIHHLISNGYDGSDDSKLQLQKLLPDKDSYRPDQVTVFFPNSINTRKDFLREYSGDDDDAVMFVHDALQDKVWMEESVNRSSLESLLSTNISDDGLKQQLIDVLQQPAFGPYMLFKYAIDKSDTTVSERSTTERLKACVKLITPEVGLQIVREARELKKQYLLRLIDATTGEKLLAGVWFDGRSDGTPDHFANLTGKDLSKIFPTEKDKASK